MSLAGARLWDDIERYHIQCKALRGDSGLILGLLFLMEEDVGRPKVSLEKPLWA